MVSSDLLVDKVGKIMLMLGNEAIARGAIEGGVSVVAAYPGTPSSEIADTLSALAPKGKFYMEYSTNEKVAMEMAVAASFCNLRSLTCMKHVGLNVASDTFMSLVHTGTKGGMVVVTVDDPFCWSSQNEQDNRYYALMSGAPMLEPSDPQEAKDITAYAFKLSEELQEPVLVRSTTRISHTRSNVAFGTIQQSPILEGKFDADVRFALLPSRSRVRHVEILKKLEQAREISEKSSLNTVSGIGEIGVITSGVAYTYLREALDLLDVQASVLKLGFTHPLPEKKIITFLESHNPIIVVEELEPYLENQVRILSSELKNRVKIFGKRDGFFPRTGEYNTTIIINGLCKSLGIKKPTILLDSNKASAESTSLLSPRPPILCAACPHRATYQAVKVASKRYDPVYSNDIGCYSLAAASPIEMYDTMLCMGSGTGISAGLTQVQKRPVIAFAGDSTFFHSCIPPLINAVYNKHNLLLIVLDNLSTAMTGFQPHPGTGISGMGESVSKIMIEDVALGVGVKHVFTVDPFDLKGAIKTISQALEITQEKGEVAVVVSRRKCSILTTRERKQNNISIIPWVVDPDVCIGCRICVDKFACPAISFSNEKAKIDPVICLDCGVCLQICPSKAIHREKQLCEG